MNTFKIILTLLAIVAFASALPTRNQPSRSYSKLCKLVDDDTDEPIFETQEYRNCLSASDRCDSDEVCCPKKTTTGSKCVPLTVFGKFTKKPVFEDVKPKYSKLCKLVDDDTDEPIFETQEYRNCLSESDRCDSDEICCPKKATSIGSKCVPLSYFGKFTKRPVFEDVKPKYSKLCKLVDDNTDEPIFETQEYRNCLSASDRCDNDEICCPKKTTTGSKCVPLSVFGHFRKIDGPQYDPRCFLLKDHAKEPIFETEVFRDCLNTDRCGLTEVCCPSLSGSKKGSNTFGGKCIPNQLLNEISKNK